MKKQAILVVLLLLPVLVYGQLFQLRSVTSAYAWQKQDDPTGTMSNHIFGYQSLQMSVAKNDVTFGTYLQGYNDFAGPVSNDPVLRLQNLFLQVRNLADVVDVTVGRQAVFAGVGNGSMDGVRATARFMDARIRVTGYGGGLLPESQKAKLAGDLANNYMAGGQVVVEALPWLRTSLSLFDRSMAQKPYVSAIAIDNPDNVVVREFKPAAQREQLLSGDIEADYSEAVSGHLRYDFDTKLAKSSRFELFTRVAPMEHLALTLEYMNREPRLFYNSLFTAFTYGTLQEVEGGVEYQLMSDLSVFGRLGSLSYGDETETRVTVGGSWTYASASLSHSVGVESRISAFSFSGGYPMFDNMVTPNLLLSYAQYKLTENEPADGVLSLGAGVTVRPMSTLSLDTQLQWNQNKILANDLRLFVRVNYFLSNQLGIF